MASLSILQEMAFYLRVAHERGSGSGYVDWTMKQCEHYLEWFSMTPSTVQEPIREVLRLIDMKEYWKASSAMEDALDAQLTYHRLPRLNKRKS